MRRFYLFLFFLAFAFLAFFACAKKEKMVAQIGDERITTKRFSREFQNKVGARFDSPEQELAMRRNFLNRMIEQKLLVAAAYEQKLDTLAELNQMMEAQERDVLIRQLYTMEVLDKSEVTEKELEDYYKNLGEEIQLKHILVESKGEAEELYQRLKKGEEFEKLALEFSQDTVTKDKGGDLGFFTYDRMSLEFRESAFELKEGEFSKPIKTYFGWHILKVGEKKKTEQKPYQEIKDGLKANLQRVKQQELGYRYIEDLKERLHFEIVAETRDKLLAPLEVKQTTDTLPQPPTIWDPTKVNPEDKELVLATYQGGEFNVSKFVEEFSRIPPMRQPRIRDSKTLEMWVWQLFLPALLYEEAKRRKVDQTEGYKETLKEIREQRLAENMRYGVLFKEIEATEEEIKDYYENNKEAFVKDAEVYVREIMVKTKDEAEDLLKRIKAGEDFSKLATERTIRDEVKARGGDLGSVKRTRYPEIFDYAMKMKKGDLGGPLFIKDFKHGKGWSVIEILDKKGGEQQSFEEVQALVKNRITGERKLKIFDDFLSEMKGKLNVQIFEDVLESTLTTKPAP